MDVEFNVLGTGSNHVVVEDDAKKGQLSGIAAQQ